MKRYGQIIWLKDGALNEYASYDADVWPEVLKTIAACGNDFPQKRLAVRTP